MCDFLYWLKHHNCLYYHIEIDNSIIPGIKDHIIYNTNSPPNEIFAAESAGFTDHPASSFVGDNQPMIEHSGVSDPNGHYIPGRSYTASALKNLSVNIKNDDLRPDLIIQNGSEAICEHSNPVSYIVSIWNWRF